MKKSDDNFFWTSQKLWRSLGKQNIEKNFKSSNLLPGMINPKMMAEVGCGCNQNFFSSQGYNRMQHRQSTEEAVEGRYLKSRPFSLLLLHYRTTVRQNFDLLQIFQPSNNSNLKANISQVNWVLCDVLTANIFESGPMPTPWKFLDSLPVIPSC